MAKNKGILDTLEWHAVAVTTPFKLFRVGLHKDGSLYITIFRSDRIADLVRDLGVVDTRLSASTAKETRISVHPTPKSLEFTMTKTHVLSDELKGEVVSLSDSLKVYDEYIPLALIATGMPSTANIVEETSEEMQIAVYDPRSFQLRTFLFVSRRDKKFPRELIEPDMIISGMLIGEYSLFTICTLWPYPSTDDGMIITFGTDQKIGPAIGPVTAEYIKQTMREALIKANTILAPYLPNISLPRHGSEVIDPKMSWRWGTAFDSDAHLFAHHLDRP